MQARGACWRAAEPGHTAVGGMKVGRCEREALLRLVFCEEHASPVAMGMVIRQLEKGSGK